MTANSITNTADLRKMLIETIEGVKAGTIDQQQASAISQLSGKILMSARLDLDAIRLNSQSEGRIASGTSVLQLVSLEAKTETKAVESKVA